MESSPNILKILQGIPGAGRNNYIKQQTSSRAWPMYAMVCSEDQFTPEVIAGYNPLIEAKLSPSALCFRRAVHLMTSGAPFVIIDNVNSSVAEAAPYVRLAEAYGYKYEVIFIKQDYSTDQGYTDLDIHNAIEYADWPEEWNRSVVDFGWTVTK